MREIKFRVRDTKNNKWVDAVPSLEYLLDDGDHSISHHDIDEESGIYTYPKNITGDTFNGRLVWQQYTGLKDKNGKEIYEGDIIERMYDVSCFKLKNGEILEGVEPGHFMIEKPVLSEVKWYGVGFDLGVKIQIGWRKKDAFKVVGNIFENSELLK